MAHTPQQSFMEATGRMSEGFDRNTNMNVYSTNPGDGGQVGMFYGADETLKQPVGPFRRMCTESRTFENFP